MSRVSNELFMGSKTEEEIALSSDPEYEPWSKELEDGLEKQFSDVEPDEPVF